MAPIKGADPLSRPDAVYLDHAATAPTDAGALAQALPYLQQDWGNPSSLHGLGARAERALRAARGRIAASLGGQAADLILTGGGTEANNLALRGVVSARRRQGNHVVTTAVEHPSVLETCRDLEQSGAADVDYVPPEADGTLDPRAVADRVREDTVLVSVMHVQNETGAVFDVEAVARAVKRQHPKVVVHVDGVQAFGKLPLRLGEGAVDLYSISGHKLGAPKGVGALWCRSGLHLVPLITGGGQEGGRRSGTENVFGTVALGAVAALALGDLTEFEGRVRALGARLREGFQRLGAVINSPPPASSAPWLVNASFPGAAAEVLLHGLEEQAVYVSTVAACASRKGKRSHVLEAMGLADERVESALRFSLGRATSDADVDRALEVLEQVLPRVRRAAGRRGRRQGGKGRSLAARKGTDVRSG